MVAVKSFGSFEGKQVEQFTLTSTTGVEVDILNWGVVVRDWRVPVGGGKRSVVLGFESFEPYPAHSPYFGAVVGRVANRIGGGRFSLDGKTYAIVANEGANTLHGGPRGFGKLVWEAKPDDAANAVVFSHTSADGDMGFPGTVKATATYRLTGNRLRLDFAATTDRPTPVSLVQHQYFNLGTGADVLDHEVQLAAHAYTEVGAGLIPTGNILEVTPGSDRDFSTPRTLRDASGKGLDYDGNFVLDSGRDPAEPVAVVRAPDKSLQLRLWTDQPGLQFYNAVYTNIPVPGLAGRMYGKNSGFCLEDQAFPDAVNHPHFPSIIITPERPYAHFCEIEIG
ncbi:MAG: aldose epimerase family protein [Devosia sp.]